MHQRYLWLWATASLILLWIITSVLLKTVRNQRSTADKIAASVQGVELHSLTPTQRTRFLENLTTQLNQLEFAERQKLQINRPLDPLFLEMTETERLTLLEKTLPQGFTQLMESLNRMTPDERKKFVQRGMQDLEEARERFTPPQGGPAFDENTLNTFMQQGFQSYLEQASSETKMDLAPLLEQIQVNLQGLRNP
jgi:hypothetical protein